MWPLILLISMGLTGCYVTRMAVYHNDLFNTRRLISEVLEDPSTTASTRSRLESVQKILAFAATSGLHTEGAYRYFIATKEPVVSHLVQAAQPDRLEFVTWWFPVVGSVPYLGFFTARDRDAKAAELEAQGLDVYTTGAGAFSSLGWFEDPVFSSMLIRGEADLAHLFLHELTHRTLWVPGTVEFNENLAEYIASVLTRRYLVASGQAALLPGYEAKLRDKRLFRGWLKELKEGLVAVFDLYKDGPKATLYASKRAVIQRFVKPPRKPEFKVIDYVAGETWNNASILGAALYAPDLERFARAHRCVEDDQTKGFLEALRSVTEELAGSDSSEPAFAALDGLCREKRASEEK